MEPAKVGGGCPDVGVQSCYVGTPRNAGRSPAPRGVMDDGEVSLQAKERLCLLYAFMSHAMCLGDQGLSEVQSCSHINLAMLKQQTIDPGPTIFRPICPSTLIH